MANNRSRTAAKATKTAETASPAEAAKTAEVIYENAHIVPKEIDPHQYITVKNGFHGELVYRSARTGELFTWNSFGSEQEMELQELRNAKNTAKDFFINNWFMFGQDDSWVIDYLGLERYYRYAVGVDGFDEIFRKTPAEIKKIVKELSAGQKKSMAYRAADMISSGEIDSRKVIAALEDALGVELIEK